MVDITEVDGPPPFAQQEMKAIDAEPTLRQWLWADTTDETPISVEWDGRSLTFRKPEDKG